MARDIDSIFLSADIWALTGDRTPPTFPVNTGWGPQYEQDPLSGGLVPERQNFNDEFYRLSLIANLTTLYGGGLEWDSTIPYVQGATCVGSDGNFYFAKSANTNVDPALDVTETTWGNLSALSSSSVDSVFGRSGAVVATAGDYDAPKIDYTSPANTTSHTEVDTALDDSLKYIATSGQVKISSYNGVSEDKPTVNVTTSSMNTLFGPFQVNYGPNLNFSSAPTNQFPIMDPNKNDASIWDNTNLKFRESNSFGQNHIWRFIFDYSRANNSKVQVIIRLRNPDSGFETCKRLYFSEENQGFPDNGRETIELFTIADNSSLDPNRGYFLEILIYGDNGADIDFTLDSTVRFSFANSNQGTV